MSGPGPVLWSSVCQTKGCQLSDGEENLKREVRDHGAASKYPEFNEDLIFLVAAHRRVPAGAGSAISRLAGCHRSQLSRLISDGEQSGASKVQQARTKKLPKLRSVPRADVARELGLVSAHSATRLVLAAANQSDLKRSLAIFYDELPPPDPLVAHPQPTDTGDDPMIDPVAIAYLAEKYLARAEQPLVVFSAAHSGCGHALFNLHSIMGLRQEQFLHVTPERNGSSIDQVVSGICRHLDITSSSAEIGEAPTASISTKLRAEGICLVIHNAHLIKSIPRLSLLDFARRVSLDSRVPARIRPLVLHYPYGQQLDLPSVKKLKAEVVDFSPDGVRGSPRDMEDVLTAMVEFVQLHREEAGENQIASLRERPSHARLRRQMELLRLSDLPPNRSSLLLRAAALADQRLIEIEDPTLGFTGIVGERLLEKRSEFARLRYDIIAVLEKMQARHLLALRLISTTAHWLTREMVEDIESSLSRKGLWTDLESLVEGSGLGLASWRLDPVQTEAISIDATPIREGSDDKSRARSALTVKSVVQEHWRSGAPESYVAIQLELARILSKLCDASPSEQALRFQKEYFHVSPPEGPSLVFSTEAVRYAVRAYEASWLISKRSGTASLASTVDQARKSCAEIIQTCLDRLDGATGLDQPRERVNHVLSRRFGRYQLKLELLHLVSENNRGERPLEVLSTDRREKYFREMGVARFGLLHPIPAWEAFGRGIQTAVDDDVRIDCVLHRASLASITYSFAAAKRCIDEAKYLAETIGNAELKKILVRRITVREANLARAQGDLKLACETFDRVLDHKARVPLDGDAAVACVDAFIDFGSTQSAYLEKALYLAELNSSHFDRENSIHEASRFDIRRARIFCRMGLPAVSEALLDDVAIALFSKGGSPRLFLDFCLAAGETMIAHGYPEWAYAGYLRAGLDISDENNLKVSRHQFAIPALNCLRSIKHLHLRHKTTGKGELNSILLERIRREHGPKAETMDWPPPDRRRFLFDEYNRLSEKSRSPYHGFDLRLRFEQQGIWAEKLSDRGYVDSGLERVVAFLRDTEDSGIFDQK